MAPIEKGSMDESTSVQVENHVSTISNDQERTCWGCGLRLQLKSYSPIFKCGYCGAITDKGKSLRKPDSACFSKWRHIRDRFFITLLLFFMLFVICAGVWAVYPIVFSIGYICGIVHCTITSILSIITISSFCLASFTTPGAPSHMQWGSYPIVGQYRLDNYTYCMYCKKPKPPRAHHCRSCRMCVMDMDHHCPFIGNCVGAANHQYFIAFLMSVVVSCTYIFLMSIYAGYHIWPQLKYDPAVFRTGGTMNIVKEIVYAMASSALLLSTRGLVLIYLAFASLSVEIGISALLWQQLSYIYEGNTYINQISPDNAANGKRGCHNLSRFFGCPNLVSKIRRCPGFSSMNNSKLL